MSEADEQPADVPAPSPVAYLRLRGGGVARISPALSARMQAAGWSYAGDPVSDDDRPVTTRHMARRAAKLRRAARRR